MEEFAAHARDSGLLDGGDEERFDENYAYEFDANYEVFDEKFDAKVAHDLMEDGYSVIDNFLGFEWAMALRQELQWLHQKGLMKPNKTHFLGEGGKVLEFSKPHISELDLHDNSARSRVPALK
ncbi:unnamed protein product, partial [Heterosigma akashiwo]